MGRSEDIANVVSRMVELGRVARCSNDQVAVRRLRAIIDSFHENIGESIPKSRAALLLDVSVPAIDRAIAKGWIRSVERDGISRQEVFGRDVVEIAIEAAQLRAAGRVRGVLRDAARARDRRQARARSADDAAELIETISILSHAPRGGRRK